MKTAIIMIVEDDRTISNSISDWLKQLGYTLSAVVRSGEKAVEKALADPPDLILMDIAPAGSMDGIEAARRIGNHIPVIYLTSSVEKDLLERVKVTEMFGYLVKPVARDRLHVTIEVALNKAQMVEKLRTSEERYRILVEKMNEGVVIIDENRIIRYANEKLCSILGYERNQIVGSSLDRYFDGGTMPEVERQWGKRKRGEPGTYEIAVFKGDGSRFQVLVSATPIFDEKKAFRGSSAVITDITELKKTENLLQNAHDVLEKKVRESTADLESANARLKEEVKERTRAESALRVSELSLQKIYDNSPVMMHSIDENGIFRKVNQYWLHTMGYRREEVIGRKVDFIMTPESRSRAFSEVIPRLWAEGFIRNISYQYVKKDGTRMDVLLDSGITEDPSGKRYSVSVIRDVTEQNRVQHEIWEAKQLLRTVVDGISDPLVMVDKGLKIRMLNFAALRYYGLSDYKDAIGRSCFAVLKTDSSLCHKCSVPSAVKNGTFVSFERRGVFDSARVEQVAAYPVETGADSLNGGIIRITDITDQKKVDEQLIRADRLSSLGQLSAGIAHEIRNPLSGISLFADILSDETKFERTAQELEIIDEIKANIVKINQIIKRVLDFARHGDSSLKEIDINQLIREVFMLWYSRIRNRGERYELFLEDPLPSVMGDFIGIQQILNNLIQNAVDAMGEGGYLSISTAKGVSAFHSEKPVVIITVQDTGTGIDGEINGKIFDPFFTTKSSGTGLGLSISYQILERQGGFITYTSEPGKGTAFTVELPAAK